MSTKGFSKCLTVDFCVQNYSTSKIIFNWFIVCSFIHDFGICMQLNCMTSQTVQERAPNGSALWFLIAKHFRNPHSGHTDPLLNLFAF